MLDKETVTARPSIQKSDSKEEVFLKCVDRAKEHVEDENVQECFQRAMQVD